MSSLTVLDMIENVQYEDELLAIIELLKVYIARGFGFQKELDAANEKLQKEF